VIWTHRELGKMRAFFPEHGCHGRSIFSSSVDPQEVSRHWVRKVGYMLSKALEYRFSGTRKGGLPDIRYSDLVGDATDQALRVYHANGQNYPGYGISFTRAEASIRNGRYAA